MDLFDSNCRIMPIKSSDRDAVASYIDYHAYLPDSYPNMSTEEIERAMVNLRNKKISVPEKMQAIVILAHAGTLAAHQALLDYQPVAEAELKIWLKIAIDESEMWLDD